MKCALKRLWFECDGGAYALQVILFSSIMCIGAMVGLTTFRDQIVQQFGDTAMALENINQTWSAGTFGGFVDTGTPTTDPIDSPPAGLGFTPPTPEGT